MGDVFLEVILKASDLAESGIEGRDELEDPLNEALMTKGVGEVTGGGGGSGVSILDVEIQDEDHLEEGLEIIRRVLRDLGAPSSTLIRRPKPIEVIYRLYE